MPPKEKLQTAILAASKKLEQKKVFQSSSIESGQVYVFNLPIEATIEWLVVRKHPDDSTLVLLVPIDDFPLLGSVDTHLFGKNQPMFARCGQSVWVEESKCIHCVDEVTFGALHDVRQRLASLARGQHKGTQTDEDIDYLFWLDELEIAGDFLVNN